MKIHDDVRKRELGRTLGLGTSCAMGNWTQKIQSYRFAISMLLACFIISGIQLCLPAFQKQSDGIRILPCESINLGRVAPNAPQRIDFRIESSDNFEMVIVDVRIECRCTVVELPNERIVRQGRPFDFVVEWTPTSEPAEQLRHVAVLYIRNSVMHTHLLKLACQIDENH